jgi:dihydroxyacetone kinase
MFDLYKFFTMKKYASKIESFKAKAEEMRKSGRGYSADQMLKKVSRLERAQAAENEKIAEDTIAEIEEGLAADKARSKEIQAERKAIDPLDVVPTSGPRPVSNQKKA